MSNVNLLILPDWVQRGIQEMYSAKTAKDFDTAFDAFIAPNARIQFNGKHISREQYKKTIRGDAVDDAGSSVTFNSVVSVQDSKSEVVRFHFMTLPGSWLKYSVNRNVVLHAA